MIDATTVGAGVIVLAGAFEGLRRWSARRRLGRARVVPARLEARPGAALSGVLEAGAPLAQAREIRFELVEAGGWSSRRRVRETVVLPFTAFQVVEGVARMPVTLTMPADARSQGSAPVLESLFNVLVLHEFSSRDVKWQLHASADVEGVPFRARFSVALLDADTKAAPRVSWSGGPFPVPPPDRPRPPKA